MTVAASVHFITQPHGFTGEAKPASDCTCGRTTSGAHLLHAAAIALNSGRIEAVDLHLANRAIVRGVLAVAIDGHVVHAATRAGCWTHSIALDQVAMVAHVGHGGRRD
jgi:hypothetical protein